MKAADIHRRLAFLFLSSLKPLTSPLWSPMRVPPLPSSQRSLVASWRCYRRNWGGVGLGGGCGVDEGCCESAFSQQLALHKAFITPKRLRLPKPERDKRCPFICNDVEAGGNWSEFVRARGGGGGAALWRATGWRRWWATGLFIFTHLPTGFF